MPASRRHKSKRRQVAQCELKREAGVNPARTRHCNRGAVDEIH